MVYFLVFIGGGLGSICRVGISHLLNIFNFSFPWATFLANALSCIVLGVLVGFSLKGSMGSEYKVMLMTGFCGGFSTFSTFTNDTLLLFQSGQLSYAFANIFLSLLVCLVCIYLGMKLV